MLMVWSCYAVTDASTFLVAWVAHGVLSGCYFTSSASLSMRLFPRAKFAQFASAASLCTAVASMAIAPLMGLLIDNTGGIYRYTFVVGAGFVVSTLFLGIYVYIKFMRYGGPKGYVAP